jgi:hypothetical protein
LGTNDGPALGYVFLKLDIANICFYLFKDPKTLSAASSFLLVLCSSAKSLGTNDGPALGYVFSKLDFAKICFSFI